MAGPFFHACVSARDFFRGSYESVQTPCIYRGTTMRTLAVAMSSLVFAVVARADAAPPPAPQAPSGPQGCSAPEYRQFDFMAGEWNVGPTGKGDAPSRAKWAVQGKGCSIQENWFPKSGGNGNSINYFDLADKQWHQHWIGADGDAVHYVGAWTGKKMEFRADDISTPQMAKVVLTMTFEPLADGSVRQSGTQSTDGGKTFQPAFDLTYRKAK